MHVGGSMNKGPGVSLFESLHFIFHDCKPSRMLKSTLYKSRYRWSGDGSDQGTFEVRLEDTSLSSSDHRSGSFWCI